MWETNLNYSIQYWHKQFNDKISKTETQDTYANSEWYSVLIWKTKLEWRKIVDDCIKSLSKKEIEGLHMRCCQSNDSLEEQMTYIYKPFIKWSLKLLIVLLLFKDEEEIALLVGIKLILPFPVHSYLLSTSFLGFLNMLLQG